ncbi:MAG: drug/metabolite transporter (DMT)-like permease, partial [Polyangiales bacterium]
MSSMTLALIAAFLLSLGALLSRYAPRQESRAIAVGFSGLALVASISGTLVDGGMSTDHTL